MKKISGAMLSKMVVNASKLLESNKDYIDSLNVFPVPDGDTGTNMYLTFKSACNEVNRCKSNSLIEIANAFQIGALRGARGNSGVISSQVIRGLCQVIGEEDECSVKKFIDGLQKAKEVAYGAVSKPQEGTILTVIRMVAEKCSSSKPKDFEELFTIIVDSADEAVNLTPTMLPVLKKAGVVDSGGKGLYTIFKGMRMAIFGEFVEGSSNLEEEKNSIIKTETTDVLNLGPVEFGYCTEFFIINLKRKTTLAQIDSLREYLMSIGDCVLVIGDLNFVKVHVHTNTPGIALSKALELGELDNIKIDNLFQQQRELVKKYQENAKKVGMLSICSGDGISKLFKDLGVDEIIEGGQTMNPSAQDIADAICKINAENILVFPNNKNILLAAEQSKQLIEGKKIHIIPSKNIPQGLSAVMLFNPDIEVDVMKTQMLDQLDNIVAGQVTYAVRTTVSDNISLKKGDIIGLNDKKILVKDTEINKCVEKLVGALKTEDHYVLNLYYGKDVKKEDAEALKESLQAKYEDMEVDLFEGGQSVYYYIVSLE